MKKQIKDVLVEKNQGINLDIGGGGNPQKGFVNMDYRPLPEVDIVHDIELFPWPIPTESVSFAIASHVLEHITKGHTDPKLVSLIKLLLAKKLITEKEVNDLIGEINPGPIMIRFFDEVWRILKPEGKIALAMPYGGSSYEYQDPTHLSPIVPALFAYFDPLATNSPLYSIYRPLPWKVVRCEYQEHGFLEAVLEKRRIDKSYNVLSKIPE